MKDNPLKTRSIFFTVITIEAIFFLQGLIFSTQFITQAQVTYLDYILFYFLTLLLLCIASFYRSKKLKSFFQSIWILLIVMMCMPFLYSLTTSYIGSYGTAATLITVELMKIVFVTFLLSRIFFKLISNYLKLFRDKVIIIGDGLKSSEFPYEEYIKIEDLLVDTHNLKEDPFFLNKISKLVDQYDRIILDFQKKEFADEIALLLSSASNSVEVLREQTSLPISQIRTFHGFQTLKLRSQGIDFGILLSKFFIDFPLVILSIPLWLPIIVICAIAIRIDSQGPVIFKQRRIGFRNRFFYIYKFRTMYHDQMDKDGSQLTLKHDERVTKVGSFLRKTSLDELPQLFNVLKFQMSLVGPRPSTTKALAGGESYWHDFPDYWQRHKMLPGMTGLAQIRGFRGNTFKREDILNRVKADLEYLETWSVSMDIRILFLTFRSLFSENAF